MQRLVRDDGKCTAHGDGGQGGHLLFGQSNILRWPALVLCCFLRHPSTILATMHSSIVTVPVVAGFLSLALAVPYAPISNGQQPGSFVGANPTGMEYGPSSALGNEGLNAAAPTKNAITIDSFVPAVPTQATDFVPLAPTPNAALESVLVPGQELKPSVGVYLDFQDATDPQPIRGSNGATDPGPSM